MLPIPHYFNDSQYLACECLHCILSLAVASLFIYGITSDNKWFIIGSLIAAITLILACQIIKKLSEYLYHRNEALIEAV